MVTADGTPPPPGLTVPAGKFYDPVWFYDSPLPQRFDPIFAEQQTKDFPNTSTRDEDRKSFLATPLFLDADFWINLPVYTDHPMLGVNGALVNARSARDDIRAYGVSVARNDRTCSPSIASMDRSSPR